MSKKRVHDFLVEMSEDQNKRKRFEDDPQGFIETGGAKTSGFTDEEKTVLASKDRKKMAKFLGMNAPPDFFAPEPPPKKPPHK